MKRNPILTVLLALLTALCCAACAAPQPQRSQPAETEQPAQTEQPQTPQGVTIRLATTTSVDNSGLLGYLLPRFTEETGIGVDVIAVGTGRALELGQAGDVDIILVHDPEAEEKFISEGYGVERRYVARNEFVIVGPEADPAGIHAMNSAQEAFRSIMDAHAKFISRGDNSGTHMRELSIWNAMGVTPEGEWYVEAGQGMGAVLTMANEMLAYTLTDTGTFYSMEDNLDLVVLFSGDPILDNIYSIIPLNPAIHPSLKHAEAMKLADWITGPEAIEMINGFEVNGHQLFRVE
jgi:tungstate transport system substrate-binding protein